jgi:uncharacterized protein
MGERIRRALASSLVIAAMLLSGCSGDRPPTEFLSLGTAGTGGIYYPLGGAIASLMSIADSSRQFTAEVTGGAVENIMRLKAGQIDFAFATANTVFEAFHGSPDFDGEPITGLRVLAPLYPNFTHVLVADGVDARDISEFGGLRVSVGAPGSGTEQMSRQILAVHGLSYDEIDARFLTFTETAAALRDRAIDAAILSVGYPAAAVLEATTTAGVRVIAIRPDRISELSAAFPYYVQGEIPAGAYPGVEGALTTASLLNWVIAMDSLSDDVVSQLLNTIDQQRVQLEQVTDMARQIDMDELNSAPIPLHGASAIWIQGRR